MPTTLISFIGRGRDSEPGEPGGSRSGYSLTEYDFGGGRVRKSTFFGWTLLQHLRDEGVAPDKWLIIGTAGSLWGGLADVLEGDVPDTVIEWAHDVLEQDKRSGCVEQALLDRAPAELPGLLGVGKVALEIVDECRDRESQHCLMSLFLRHLEENDEVILDVTHSYRHLPIMAAFMMSPLRWLRGVKVRGIYYGALDMRRENGGISPVVDLSICADYNRKDSILATFATTGDYSEAASLFPDAAGDLSQTSFLEKIARMGDARAPARRVMDELEKTDAVDPLLAGIGSKLQDALRWSREGRFPQRMLEKSRFLLERGEYMNSLILCLESIFKKVFQTHFQGDPNNYDEETSWEIKNLLKRNLVPPWNDVFRGLNDLRNAAVHGTRASRKEVQPALRSEEEFKALLERGMDLAGKLISGEISL